MSITVELYLDSAWRSVEAQQPIIINEALHNSLASATSSCRVNIIPNSTIKNYLLGLENADADIRIKDGSTVLFQGLLRKNFTIRKLEQRQDLYGLEAVGYLIKLDRKVKEDKQYASKSVSYIVEDLFTELGINYSLPTITSIINNLYIKRGESYRIIEQLLKEYGYIIYVDNEGTARAIEISPASITTTETFDDSNTLDALELNKKEQDKERIEIEYRQQKTAASGIVFSDTTNAQGVYKCYIQLAAGAYLGGQQYVYADLVYDGKKVIALSSHTLDITADSGITVSTNILEGNKVKLSIQNTSGITKNIYKLDIIGSVIVYEDSAGKEIATSNSDTDKIETIQAKYLFTSTNAQNYAQKLLNYYKYSDFVYTLSSMTDATLGEQVLLNHEGIGAINARIIEKQKDYQTGKIRYKLEGISEYSAESSGSEPSYTAPDPLNNQAIILTYPEQPTNNVTNVDASFSENADGTANVVVEFSYTQGEKPATQFLCYVLRSFSTPGVIDYYTDQAVVKPYTADGDYAIPFSLPTRAGSAPIHYKIGVVAANGSKLHADGAVIPTGWSDKTLTGALKYDSNNYWDLDDGKLRAGSSSAYIYIDPSLNLFVIQGLRVDLSESGVQTFANPYRMTLKDGSLNIQNDNTNEMLARYGMFTPHAYAITAEAAIDSAVDNDDFCLVEYSSALWCFYRTGTTAYYKTYNGSSWSSATSLGTSLELYKAITFDSKLFLVFKSGTEIHTKYYNGSSWSSSVNTGISSRELFWDIVIYDSTLTVIYNKVTGVYPANQFFIASKTWDGSVWCDGIEYFEYTDIIRLTAFYDASAIYFMYFDLNGDWYIRKYDGNISEASALNIDSSIDYIDACNTSINNYLIGNYITSGSFYLYKSKGFELWSSGILLNQTVSATAPNISCAKATFSTFEYVFVVYKNDASNGLYFQKIQEASAYDAAPSNPNVIQVSIDATVDIYLDEGLPLNYEVAITRTCSSDKAITVYATGEDSFTTGASYSIASFVTHPTTVAAEYNQNKVVLRKTGANEWKFVDGCIIGSTSNGSYIKYADGTMICYGKKSVNTTMTVLNENIGSFGWSFYYLPYTAGVVVDLPASYLSSSSYVFTAESDSGSICYPYHQNNTASQVKFGYVSPDGGSATFVWQTIGRWKQ